MVYLLDTIQQLIVCVSVSGITLQSNVIVKVEFYQTKQHEQLNSSQFNATDKTNSKVARCSSSEGRNVI